MTAYLVWFLLFILYLIVIPIGISPFEAPKVVIAQIIIDLLLLVKLIEFKKAHLKHLFTSQTVFVGMLFILSLDQLFLFRDFQSFFGNPFRMQGPFLLWHLMIFSLISKGIKIDHIPKTLYYLSFVFLFLATMILGVNQNNRAFGSLGEPNALASTALFLFPFVLFRVERFTKIAVALTAFLVIFLSGSRAGLIGFGLELIFVALINSLKVSTLKSVILTILLIAFALFLPFVEGGWFENRGQIWQTAVSAGFESPFIGQGFGNIQNSIHQFATKLNNQVQYQVVDSSHNFLLDYWIQGGIVGIISILMLLTLSFQGLIRRKKIVELTAFLGIVTAMLFNPVSVANLLAFWWLIGQGFARDVFE